MYPLPPPFFPHHRGAGKGEHRVKTWTINPKAVTMGQLYGQDDPMSKEWTDGVLAVAFRCEAACGRRARPCPPRARPGPIYSYACCCANMHVAWEPLVPNFVVWNLGLGLGL